MLEVRLRSGAVVSFDGRVLEVFDSGGEGRRFHVSRLPVPQLENSDGQHRIVLGTNGLALPVERGEAPACRRLIAAVERARDADQQLGSG